jgi:hypothetical protein
VGQKAVPPLAHQPENLARAGIAMLDRVGAREDRVVHALGRGGVSGDGAAGSMRGLGRGAHLFHCEGRPARLARAQR